MTYKGDLTRDDAHRNDVTLIYVNGHDVYFIVLVYVIDMISIYLSMYTHTYIYTHLDISSIIAFKGCYIISRFWSGSQTHCIPRMGLRSLPQLVWWWLIFSLMWAISLKASNGWLKKSTHRQCISLCTLTWSTRIGQMHFGHLNSCPCFRMGSSLWLVRKGGGLTKNTTILCYNDLPQNRWVKRL